jgi:hypothetical protein
MRGVATCQMTFGNCSRGRSRLGRGRLGCGWLRRLHDWWMRAWEDAENHAARVWIGGFCAGVEDGVVGLAAHVADVSPDALYGLQFSPDEFTERRLEDARVSFTVLTDVITSVVLDRGKLKFTYGAVSGDPSQVPGYTSSTLAT